jgi:hypothetical protein
MTTLCQSRQNYRSKTKKLATWFRCFRTTCVQSRTLVVPHAHGSRTVTVRMAVRRTSAHCAVAVAVEKQCAAARGGHYDGHVQRIHIGALGAWWPHKVVGLAPFCSSWRSKSFRRIMDRLDSPLDVSSTTLSINKKMSDIIF